MDSGSSQKVRDKTDRADKQRPEKHAPSAYQFPEKESNSHGSSLFHRSLDPLFVGSPYIYTFYINERKVILSAFFNAFPVFFSGLLPCHTRSGHPRFRRTSRALLEPGHQLVM